MAVLVDTSVWIEYFRNGGCSEKVEFLIDENLAVTNELILTELVPFLKIRKQRKLVSLLRALKMNDLKINWEQLIDYQLQCLRMGLNGIGIPDLIIAQNATQHECPLFSLDNHFLIMKDVVGVDLFE